MLVTWAFHLHGAFCFWLLSTSQKAWLMYLATGMKAQYSGFNSYVLKIMSEKIDNGPHFEDDSIRIIPPCPDFHSSHRQHMNRLFHPPHFIFLYCQKGNGQSKETTLQYCQGRLSERQQAGTTGQGRAGGSAERQGTSWRRQHLC